MKTKYSVKIVIAVIMICFKINAQTIQPKHQECHDDCCFSHSADLSKSQLMPPVYLGIDTIICNNLFVVYSGQTYVSNPTVLKNTSNIYVLKGNADTVWIFGMGYGDPLGDDTLWSPLYKSSRNAMADAKEVDSVITDYLGINKINAKLQFISPHFHFDHINNELPTYLFDSLGYSRVGARIIIHANDYYISTCNSPCCGAASCTAITSPNAGGPYSSSWSTQNIALFTSVGSTSDTPCVTNVMGFQSPTGKWELGLRDQSHTPGTINIDNATYKIRLEGAGGGTPCSLPIGWYELGAHKTKDNFMTTTICGPLDIKEGNATEFPLIRIFPNPANTDLNISLNGNKNSIFGINVVNSIGQVILKMGANALSKGSQEYTINTTDISNGLYFIQVQSKTSTQYFKFIVNH